MCWRILLKRVSPRILYLRFRHDLSLCLEQIVLSPCRKTFERTEADYETVSVAMMPKIVSFSRWKLMRAAFALAEIEIVLDLAQVSEIS
jgi:hypothetical protein